MVESEELMALENEALTYEELLPHLRLHQGKFILINADQLGGIFATKKEALDNGYNLFGLAGFMVKEIQLVEEPIFMFGSLGEYSCLRTPGAPVNSEQ
jgi:hypothetical protein